MKFIILKTICSQNICKTDNLFKMFVKLTIYSKFVKLISYLKPIHVSIVMKDNEIRIKTCFILLNSSVELIHIQRQHINEKGILNQENQKLKNFSFG